MATSPISFAQQMQCVLAVTGASFALLLALGPMCSEAYSISATKIQTGINQPGRNHLQAPILDIEADDDTRRAEILDEINDTVQSLAELEQILRIVRGRNSQGGGRRERRDGNSCTYQIMKYVIYEGTCNYGFGNLPLCQSGGRSAWPLTGCPATQSR